MSDEKLYEDEADPGDTLEQIVIPSEGSVNE